MKLTKPISDKEVARWEKSRAKGKWFFVIRTAMIFGVGMFLTKTLVNWLWDDPVGFRLLDLIIYSIAGLLVGATFWWSGDARYQNHILDKKIHDRLKL